MFKNLDFYYNSKFRLVQVQNSFSALNAQLNLVKLYKEGHHSGVLTEEQMEQDYKMRIKWHAKRLSTLSEMIFAVTSDFGDSPLKTRLLNSQDFEIFNYYSGLSTYSTFMQGISKIVSSSLSLLESSLADLNPDNDNIAFLIKNTANGA